MDRIDPSTLEKWVAILEVARAVVLLIIVVVQLLQQLGVL
jgi:hypothetical protein